MCSIVIMRIYSHAGLLQRIVVFMHKRQISDWQIQTEILRASLTGTLDIFTYLSLNLKARQILLPSKLWENHISNVHLQYSRLLSGFKHLLRTIFSIIQQQNSCGISLSICLCKAFPLTEAGIETMENNICLPEKYLWYMTVSKGIY